MGGMVGVARRGWVVLWAVVACWCAPPGRACVTLALRGDPAGLVLRWDSAAGHVYRVEAAESPAGAWLPLGTVTASGPASSWTNGAAAGGARFFRLVQLQPVDCAGGGGAAGVTSALEAGDVLPRDLTAAYDLSRSTVADGVYLASVLAGTGQLVRTGTLTASAAGWSYAAAPADRLVVAYPGRAPVEIVVLEISGDFGGDGAWFLQRNHVLRWTTRQEGVGAVSCRSVREGGRIQAAMAGTYVHRGVLHDVDLVSDTDSYFESSFGGAETRSDTRLTGTLAGPGYRVVVDSRFRFELIVVDGRSASTSEEWGAHRVEVGADVYTWVGAKRQRSFKEGKPSSVDTYWQATGQVLRNGAAWGTFGRDAQPIGNVGRLLFVLETPEGRVELESWNLF